MSPGDSEAKQVGSGTGRDVAGGSSRDKGVDTISRTLLVGPVASKEGFHDHSVQNET
jgi:hypothetical protein